MEKQSLRPSNARRIILRYCLLAAALWASSIFVAVKISNAAVKQASHIEHTAFCQAQLQVQAASLKAEAHEHEHSNAHPTHPLPRLTCGSSSAEAEALGCIFDPLIASWLHEDCPRDGSTEFSNVVTKENLTYWYEDVDGQPSDRLIADMNVFAHLDGQMYWGTTMEHLTHCAYMLKRIIRVQQRGGRLDTVAGNFTHTDHCVDFLVEGLKKHPEELKELYRTDLPVQYLEC